MEVGGNQGASSAAMGVAGRGLHRIMQRVVDTVIETSLPMSRLSSSDSLFGIADQIGVNKRGVSDVSRQSEIEAVC